MGRQFSAAGSSHSFASQLSISWGGGGGGSDPDFIVGKKHGLQRGNFLWDILRFKFVRNFPHNFRQNKLVSKCSTIACRTVAFATGSAFVDRVQSNSLGMKCLAADSSLCRTVVHCLHTLCNFHSAMLHFLTQFRTANSGLHAK